MARACVLEERTIGPISWWRTPTKHANLSAADRSISRSAKGVAVTAHTAIPTTAAIAMGSRCAQAANPPLRSAPLATLAANTLGLSTQTDRHWVQQALVWRSAGFNKSNWLVCTRPILGLRTRPQLLR